MLGNVFFWLRWQPSITIWSQWCHCLRDGVRGGCCGREGEEEGRCRHWHDRFQFYCFFVFLFFLNTCCLQRSFVWQGDISKMGRKYSMRLVLRKGHFYFCCSFKCICENSWYLKHVLCSHCVNILLLKRCRSASPQLSTLQQCFCDDSYTISSEWVEGKMSSVCSCTNDTACQMKIN